MQNLIIDRFEGEFAVCEQEDGTMTNIKKDLLPDGLHEGDCIILQDDDTYVADPIRTEQLKQDIDDLFNSLLE